MVSEVFYRNLLKVAGDLLKSREEKTITSGEITDALGVDKTYGMGLTETLCSAIREADMIYVPIIDGVYRTDLQVINPVSQKEAQGKLNLLSPDLNQENLDFCYVVKIHDTVSFNEA